ncbi:MAG: ABC-2 family transporter protein [Candidatus Krumholzibacteriia bacterium]
MNQLAVYRTSRRASLRRQLGVLGAYFSQFLKMRLAYRADFFVDLGANLFAMTVQLATLEVLFSKVQELKGWSLDEVLFIYGFSLLPLGLFNLVSINLYGFAERYIADGNLDRVLLRPVNPLAQVLCESFNVSGLNEMLLGAGVMVYAGLHLQLHLGVLDVLVLLLLVPSAAAIYAAVFLSVTCVSFWFEDRMGLAPPIYNVIRFARYPLTIYGRWVQAFLVFVLPFAWVAYMPSTWFVGDPHLARWALLTPLVALLAGTLSLSLWRAGLRRYESTGH